MTKDAECSTPAFAAFLDAVVLRIGNALAWFNVALVAVIILQVTLRYAFGRGVVILEELQWHFYGLMLIMALSYTLVKDGHIRLDLVSCRFSPRTKEIVEILGIVFLLLPTVAVIFLHSLDFVANSWRVGESSVAPMGLPLRWAFKAFIPIGMFLYGAAACSRLAKAFSRLARREGGQ